MFSLESLPERDIFLGGGDRLWRGGREEGGRGGEGGREEGRREDREGREGGRRGGGEREGEGGTPQTYTHSIILGVCYYTNCTHTHTHVHTIMYTKSN